VSSVSAHRRLFWFVARIVGSFGLWRASSALLGCGAHSGAILEHIFAGPALDAASRLPDALTPWPAWRDGVQVGVSEVWSAADVEANATVCTWCRVSRLANPPAVSARAFMRGWRWVRPLRQVMQMWHLPPLYDAAQGQRWCVRSSIGSSSVPDCCCGPPFSVGRRHLPYGLRNYVPRVAHARRIVMCALLTSASAPSTRPIASRGTRRGWPRCSSVG
jgi:hypothetical protein